MKKHPKLTFEVSKNYENKSKPGHLFRAERVGQNGVVYGWVTLPNGQLFQGGLGPAQFPDWVERAS